jgi:hypothetical protein
LTLETQSKNKQLESAEELLAQIEIEYEAAKTALEALRESER